MMASPAPLLSRHRRGGPCALPGFRTSNWRYHHGRAQDPPLHNVRILREFSYPLPALGEGGPSGPGEGFSRQQQSGVTPMSIKKKTTNPIEVESIKHKDMRANIPTEE